METHTTFTTAPSIATAPPVDDTASIADRIYSSVQAIPKQRLTAGQIAELLHNEFTVRQVQGAIATIAQQPKRFAHLHRIDRGVYIFDADRDERKWVRIQPKKKSAVKTSTSKPVVEAKKPAERDVVAVGELRPVPGMAVMQDVKGRIFVVKATPV